MASRSPVRLDDSRISKLDQMLYWLEALLALLSGLAIFSLVMLAVFSVGGRFFFNQPLPGYVDWIEQVMPIIAFLGVAYAQRDGGHIRMDMLVGYLRGRPLWAAEFVTVICMLFVMLMLVWGSWAHFERSFDFGAPMWSRDSSMDIALPLWPAKLLAPIAFFVLSVRLVLQIYVYAKAFWNNELNPVAVPLIEDAATLAAKEADTVSD